MNIAISADAARNGGAGQSQDNPSALRAVNATWRSIKNNQQSIKRKCKKYERDT